MEITFKSIAFELKYTSAQIDAVYTVLCLDGNGTYKMPGWVMSSYRGFLPNDFCNWVEKNQDVDIIFEPHRLPGSEKEEFYDWDLVVF